MILAAWDHRKAIFLLIDADINDGRAVGDFQHLDNNAVNIVGFFGAETNAAERLG